MGPTIIRFALSGNVASGRGSPDGPSPHPRPPVHLRSARTLDVDKGELIEPGDLLVDGERIVEVAPTSVPHDAVVVDLGT
jgi:hypothetical protein